MKFCLILTVVLLCLYVSTSKAIGMWEKAENVPDFASLCPRSICNSTQDETEKAETCCQRCSCSPDCYKVASCCPDVHTDDFTEPEYQCIDLAYISNFHRGFYDTIIGEDISYRIVDKCPDENSTKAYPKCAYPSGLQDYVPVSDVSYEKVFRNWHCANCHGVFEYIPWYLSVTCESLSSLAFETFDERNEHILKHCRFEPIPSDHGKVGLSRCYQEAIVISQCNMASELNYHLRKACNIKSPNQNTVYSVLLKVPPRTQYFSNVYCFLCNHPKYLGRTDICLKQDISSVSKDFLVDFTAILQKFPDESLGKFECKSSNIWDPYDAVCRQVYCPIGTIPRNGRCQRSWKFSKGFSMAVLFEVVSPSTDDITFKNHVTEVLLKLVTEHLDPDFQCGLCQSSFYRDINETKLFVEIPFFTSKSCSHQYLHAELRHLTFKKNISMKWKLVDQSVSITLKVILEQQNDNLKHDNTFRSSVKRTICRNPVQLTLMNMNTCPRVTLKRNEFDQFSVNNSHLRMLSKNASFIDSETNTISMCINDYYLLRESMIAMINGYQEMDSNAVMNTFLFYTFTNLVYQVTSIF